MTPPQPLGEFEHVVLLAVLHLGNDAGTGLLREFLEEHTKRSIARGALYTTLDRLEQKGLVRSHMGDASRTRGGRPRRYYRVSTTGVRAMKEARATLLALWHGLDSQLA